MDCVLSGSSHASVLKASRLCPLPSFGASGIEEDLRLLHIDEAQAVLHVKRSQIADLKEPFKFGDSHQISLVLQSYSKDWFRPHPAGPVSGH